MAVQDQVREASVVEAMAYEGSLAPAALYLSNGPAAFCIFLALFIAILALAE